MEFPSHVLRKASLNIITKLDKLLSSLNGRGYCLSGKKTYICRLCCETELKREYYNRMKACEITGKTAMTGNNVSHSVRRTKRRFNPNLKTKRFWLEDEGRWITLKVSAAGIKTINKKGLKDALKGAKAPKKVY